MPDSTEQENLSTEEVVSLLQVEDPSGQPKRKGYEDYAAEAVKAATATTEVEDDKPDASKATFNMPDKFAGKTAEEIAASYVELQSEYGRRNTEVGSLRKLTDQLLELKETKPKIEPVKVTTDSLLDNPDEVINTAVDSNPRLKAIEDKLIQGDRAEAKLAFDTKHPEWDKTLHTPEFQSWVMETQLRQRLLIEADKNYDYATGSELFDMYDLEKGKAVKDATTERNAKARKSAKQAVTEDGGGGEPKGKPKYRRSELIQLKLSNPAKYDAMKEDIMQAYADKRVI